MQCTCNAKVFNYCQTHTFHSVHGLYVTLPSGVKSTLAWKSVPCTARLSVLHGPVDVHQFWCAAFTLFLECGRLIRM